MRIQQYYYYYYYYYYYRNVDYGMRRYLESGTQTHTHTHTHKEISVVGKNFNA
jgi:hypothetical protein